MPGEFALISMWLRDKLRAGTSLGWALDDSLVMDTALELGKRGGDVVRGGDTGIRCTGGWRTGGGGGGDAVRLLLTGLWT